MNRQQVTWIGASVGGYVVESLLGEGMYSWVYSCLGPQNERRAIKAAKPEDQVTRGSSKTGSFPTRALLQVTGSVIEVQPNTDELLDLQVKKLRSIKAASMPKVLDAVKQPGLSYYFMDIVPGKTLRELMSEGPLPTETLIAIGETLEALHKDPTFEYHGDLKPDNIMVDGKNIVLLDPGYFGPIGTTRGDETNIAVTTPMYYPHLTPNDAYAFGLMLWEAATGKHPLDGPHNPIFDSTRHGELLGNHIRSAQSVGKGRFINSLLAIEAPSRTNPNVNLTLEAFLLEGIGLQLTAQKKLDLLEKNATIRDTVQTLRTLKGSGLEVFRM